jgi:polysaccharide biosynthesis/export protein
MQTMEGRIQSSIQNHLPPSSPTIFSPPSSIQKQTNGVNFPSKILWQRITGSSLASLYAGATLLSSAVVLGITAQTSWAAAPNRTTGEPSVNLESIQNPKSKIQNQLAQIQIPVVPFELQNTPQRFQPNPQFRPYRLGPFDSISVVVPRFPDLGGTFLIDSEGNALLPLVGKLQIAGFTLEEAQERIRRAYNRFVVNPEVLVSLAGQRPAQITLTGEIVRPGFYGVGAGSRLSTVLLSAGGSTPQADLRAILVRRFLSDGSYIEQRLDLFTPLVAGDPLPDLFLQDGDAVIVPKIEVGTESTYDRQLVARSNLAQPTIIIRVLSYDRNTVANLNLRNGSNFVDAVTAIAPSLQTADIGNIALIRYDPERGRAIVRELNARRALFGDASQNVPLRENDVIVIGRTLSGRIQFALNALTQPFQSILQFLQFFRSFGEGATVIFGPGTGTGNNNN